jgi:serine/threonine-protein kinase PknG
MTSRPMIRCNRPKCAGVTEANGFCAVCGLPPLSIRPDPSGSTGEASGATGVAHGEALVPLPVLPDPDPDTLVLDAPVVRESERFCRRCGARVGRSWRQRPGFTEGSCNGCGAMFSFEPRLRRGQRLGRYRVIGPFAHGGVGWVYLAEDIDLNRRVVLKGLIDAGDKHSVASAAVERRYLTLLDHPNIVRALDFVAPDGQDDGAEPVGYLVMNFVGGSSLGDIIRRVALGRHQLPIEHVIGYGLEILKALSYLHERDLLYCDLKPENVIHGGDRVRLIDLGAVRRLHDGGPTWGTSGYQVPRQEIATRGLTVDSDLYTTGRTLARLFAVSGDNPAMTHPADAIAGSVESFAGVVARASHADWTRRFRSAAEMIEQLALVQREVLALRGGQRIQLPSAQFAPPASLLDAGLGVAPPLASWTHRPPPRGSIVRRPILGRSTSRRPPPPEPLGAGRPAPSVVAGRLPDPWPDPDDPATAAMAAVTASNPERLIAQLPRVRGSVEVELRRCRARLELAAQAAARGQVAGAGAALEGARADLAAARRRAPGGGVGSWRIVWHRGLVELASATDAVGVGAAETLFAEVWAELPGEPGPKLALGFCAEYRGEAAGAERNYRAVWRADDTQASAAFGLARLRLAALDRRGAVSLLDEVPGLSRHYDAARTAAFRVLVGRLGPGEPPGAADLNDAPDRLAELARDGAVAGSDRDRLVATVLRAALDWTRSPDVAPGRFEWGAAALALFGSPVTRTGLRERLGDALRELARSAADVRQHGSLVDLANAVRPWTRT